jgi:hypothetical protein
MRGSDRAGSLGWGSSMCGAYLDYDVSKCAPEQGLSNGAGISWWRWVLTELWAAVCGHVFFFFFFLGVEGFRPGGVFGLGLEYVGVV